MQKVPRHGVLATEERTSFIINNFKNKSDYEISRALNLSESAVAGYRCWLGFYKRPHNSLPDEIKAAMCEMYIETYSLKQVIEHFNSTYYTVSKLITNTLFYKKLSDETKVITLKSKV